MVSKPEKSLAEVVAEVGRYAEEAFRFVREGLNYTVEKVHGPTTREQLKLFEYLQEKNLDLSDLAGAYEAGQIDPGLAKVVEAAGGLERFNRHVSGQELCWGLRNLALEKWGMMARTVLDRWGVRQTRDFGTIVFAMVDNGLMQKQPHDAIDDFVDVFDFREAFDNYHFPGLNGSNGDT